MTPDGLPERVRYLVVGGGVWGTSIAAHLAEQGADDVLLVERYDLAEGSSWAAAGFVGQLRHTPEHIRIVADSAAQYADAERAFPGVLGWAGVGSLRFARTPERSDEIAQLVALAQSVGVDTTMLSPQEVTRRFPQVSDEDMVSAAWTPADGWLVPERLARFFADRAARAGARIETGVNVARLLVENERVVGIDTVDGAIRADTVIVAGGAFTGVLTATAGITTPLMAARVSYLVSNPVGEAGMEGLPTMREPDSAIYLRTGMGRVVVGGAGQIPELRDPATITPSRREHSGDPVGGADADFAAATRRLPFLAPVGISHSLNAWESTAVDDSWIIGPSHLDGLWVAAGGGGFGISGAGGIGNVVARSLLDGELDPMLAAFDPTRFPRDFVLDEEVIAQIAGQLSGRYALSVVHSR